MVALVHNEAAIPAKTPPPVVVESTAPLVPAELKKTKKVVPPPQPSAPRGRPRTVRNETERLYRLSVDLPGSILLKLKGAAMLEETDMKTYVRMLVERHLATK